MSAGTWPWGQCSVGWRGMFVTHMRGTIAQSQLWLQVWAGIIAHALMTVLVAFVAEGTGLPQPGVCCVLAFLSPGDGNLGSIGNKVG